MPHAADNDNAGDTTSADGSADHECFGVWVKRSSLLVSGFDPDSLTATTYDPIAVDLAEVDLDFDPHAVFPDPIEDERKGPIPADPATVDDQSSWQRINRELRSLRVEIADLRREIRSLRNQRVGQR